MQPFVIVVTCLLVWGSSVLSSWGAHGITLNGELKYAAGFSQFSYASPQAEKGGTLVLHDLGSFDKMNPFTLKGEAPFGVEMLVFDSLGVECLDEPSAEYGLIAKDVTVADDLLSVVYTLNDKAKFSDGTAVSVEDIAFSLATLKGPTVHPHYPYYYKDISGSEIIDETHIRFRFSQPNRELAMIATQIPIFSQQSFKEPGDPGSDGSYMQPPIGSGPYVISNVVQGKSITYTRNQEYWAKDHPVRKGMFNFDTIMVKYYKDQVVALEAFKAGEFDVISVNIAKQWARDMVGPRFSSGELVKKLFPHSNNAGMQGFLMNTRRAIFNDRRVRQAIGLALDFEWTNKSLFYGQYTRSESFFSNSHLAAVGVPEGLELIYLNEYKDDLPEEVFTEPLKAPVTGDRKELRENLRKASELLRSAGYIVENGVLVDSTGKPFSFEITLGSPSFERVMAAFHSNLQKLGMQVSYRTIDQTLYIERIKKFDFDMIVASFPQSLSPGNEQRNYWHSESADRPGSNNYAGIQSKAVDGLVEKIIYAKNSEELIAACKALDRVLWYGYYLVPNWYMNGYRIAYHDKFRQPDMLPTNYIPQQLIMTWWSRK